MSGIAIVGWITNPHWGPILELVVALEVRRGWLVLSEASDSKEELMLSARGGVKRFVSSSFNADEEGKANAVKDRAQEKPSIAGKDNMALYQENECQKNERAEQNRQTLTR